jgi:hypothetical protein
MVEPKTLGIRQGWPSYEAEGLGYSGFHRQPSPGGDPVRSRTSLMLATTNAEHAPPAARLGAHEMTSAAKRSTEVIVTTVSYPPSNDNRDPNRQMSRQDWSTLAFAACVTSLTGLHRMLGVNQISAQCSSSARPLRQSRTDRPWCPCHGRALPSHWRDPGARRPWSCQLGSKEVHHATD